MKIDEVLRSCKIERKKNPKKGSKQSSVQPFDFWAALRVLLVFELDRAAEAGARANKKIQKARTVLTKKSLPKDSPPQTEASASVYKEVRGAVKTLLQLCDRSNGKKLSHTDLAVEKLFGEEPVFQVIRLPPGHKKQGTSESFWGIVVTSFLQSIRDRLFPAEPDKLDGVRDSVPNVAFEIARDVSYANEEIHTTIRPRFFYELHRANNAPPGDEPNGELKRHYCQHFTKASKSCPCNQFWKALPMGSEEPWQVGK